MRQITAIALLSIRNAVRSRIVLCLLLILSAVIVILPFTVRGDGTVAGFIQIMLSYTLGLSGMILSLTTLWAGCASVATEISDKTIQMVATKPVSRLHIWTGKWLGLNLINALLLGVCGLVTYGMLHHHLGSDTFAGEDAARESRRLLSARMTLHPATPDYARMARERVTEAVRDGRLPPYVNIDAAREQARQQLVVRDNTVAPGGSIAWRFGPLPDTGRATDATLEFRFSTSQVGASILRARLRFGTPEQPDLLHLETDAVTRTAGVIDVSLDERWAGKEVVVTYEAIDDENISLIFDADRTVLLIPHGSFAGNYARMILILLGRLSLFAAIGVTAGCLFSLPVASFISLFLMFIIESGAYIEHMAGTTVVLPGSGSGEGAMSWGAVAVTLVFKGLAALIAPVVQDNPLNALATGRMIDYGWTWSGFMIQGVVYALAAGIVGTLVLKRRELALPATS